MKTLLRIFCAFVFCVALLIIVGEGDDIKCVLLWKAFAAVAAYLSMKVLIWSSEKSK